MKNKGFLLDSNILIYALSGEPKVCDFLRKNKSGHFFISVITYFEVLIGAKKDSVAKHYVESYLDSFVTIPMDKDLAKTACTLHEKVNKKLKFNDLAIAATARQRGLTLITADKDFKLFKDVDLKLIRL